MGNRSYLYMLDADNQASCILESNNNIPPFWLALFSQPDVEKIKADSAFLHADIATISTCFSDMDAANLAVDADHASSLVNRREQSLVTILLPECRHLFAQWKDYVFDFDARGFLLDFTEYTWFFDNREACIRHLSDYMRCLDVPSVLSRKKILEYAELSTQELSAPESYWCIAGDSYSYAIPWGDQPLDDE